MCIFQEREIYYIGQLDSNDWRKPIVEYSKNPNLSIDRKTRYRALSYVLLGDFLYKKSIDENLLTFLGEREAFIALAEVHEGICGAHQLGEKMKWALTQERVH